MNHDARLVLHQMLVTMGKKEAQIELVRQQLCSEADFDPHVAFRLLKEKKGISADSMSRFFAQQGISVPKPLLEQVLKKRYSYFKDFLVLVLPATNPILRARITQLQQCHV